MNASNTYPFATANALPMSESGIRWAARGDSYDDALTGAINGLYKAEPICQRAVWKTKESLKLSDTGWFLYEPHCLPRSIGEVSS